jgi:hypothetical protein
MREIEKETWGNAEIRFPDRLRQDLQSLDRLLRGKLAEMAEIFKNFSYELKPFAV